VLPATIAAAGPGEPYAWLFLIPGDDDTTYGLAVQHGVSEVGAGTHALNAGDPGTLPAAYLTGLAAAVAAIVAWR